VGATLVSMVLDRWSHLPEPQYRTLLRMALTALDEPSGGKPPAQYWGGNERIARIWRQPFPEGDSDEEERRRKSTLKNVQKAIHALIKEGAIEIIDTGRPVRSGHAQVYRLTL
jgi:hypothetical protein